MIKRYNKDEVIKLIKRANMELRIAGYEGLSFYIVGGSSLMFKLPNRTTIDIDIVNVMDMQVRKIVNKYEINDAVATSVDPQIRDYYGYFENTSDLLFDIGNKWFLVWPEVIYLNKKVICDRDKDVLDAKMLLELKLLDGKKLMKAVKSIRKYGTKDGIIFDTTIDSMEREAKRVSKWLKLNGGNNEQKD